MGIQQGVTIALLARIDGSGPCMVRYRNDLDQAKAEGRRRALVESLDDPNANEHYVRAFPSPANRYSPRPQDVSSDYAAWPRLVDVAAVEPFSGLSEKPRVRWNKGKLIGPKPPLQPKHVWAIRTRLQLAGRTRDLALFNLAIDSKLRGCDMVSLKVEDVAPHGYAIDRATVRQNKTGSPVRFEITEQTRRAIDEHLAVTKKRPGEFLFHGRRGKGRCLSTRQYARLLSEWIASIGLDPSFGTHSLRRTKATLIYRRTGNFRAVQLLLGHTKVESTVRYLGIEVDDALAIAEQIDV